MKQQLWITIGVLLVTAPQLVGCDAKSASAPKTAAGMVSRDLSGRPVDTATRFFAPSDVTFNYAQIFMWKDNVSDADVETVLENTTLLEDAQDQIYLLNQGLHDVIAGLNALGISVTDYFRDVNEELPPKQAQLAAAQKQLADLQAQPQSDETNKQIEKTKLRIAKLTEKIAPILKARDLVTSSGKEKEVADLAARRDDANRYLQPINDLTWIFNSSPIHFSFGFSKDGGLHASISNWDLAKIDDPEIAETGVPVDFSTEPARTGEPRINHVTYDPMGGVYTFEVHSPAAVYWFKIARAKYDAIDQRIHYKGELVRCSVAGGAGTPVLVRERDLIKCGVQGAGVSVLRRGAANLVDQDDNS